MVPVVPPLQSKKPLGHKILFKNLLWLDLIVFSVHIHMFHRKNTRELCDRMTCSLLLPFGP